MSIRNRLASRRPSPTWKPLLLALGLALATHALAYEGLTFGLQIAPPASGAVPLTVNVLVPIATLHDGAGTPVGVALRGDVSYAVGADLGPSAGVNVQLSDAAQAVTFARPYFGVGAAMANDAGAMVPTAYGVVGWRVPLSDVFGVRLEALTNVTVRSAALQLGFDFSPWGAR